MKFEIDTQTLKDIEILDSHKSSFSVFNIFNQTRCVGGKDRLYKYLKNPLINSSEIKKRSDAIAFFQELEFTSDLDIDKNTLDFIEHYLLQEGYPTKPPSIIRTIEKSLYNKMKSSNSYYIIERGVDYTIDLLNNLYTFSIKLKGTYCPELIMEANTRIIETFGLPEFKEIARIKNMKKLGALTIAKFDYIFRYTHRDTIRYFLDLIYDYDVFISVSGVAAKKGYSYSEILPKDDHVIELEGLFHPSIPDPVSNYVNLSFDNNLLFITGSNMAGKSSLLKAMAIAVYLAHVGFPIPAAKSRISLLNGIYTTINISDNLSLGYSHFYAEVLRIKHIAERLTQETNMLIVFDELFRGTNVKDAYEGSLAIISAFSEIKGCFFAISTHIIEVAESLSENHSIQFLQMEVLNDKGFPEYTYLLKKGISDVRMGMYIIGKENVVQTIQSINKRTT